MYLSCLKSWRFLRLLLQQNLYRLTDIGLLYSLFSGWENESSERFRLRHEWISSKVQSLSQSTWFPSWGLVSLGWWCVVPLQPMGIEAWCSASISPCFSLFAKHSVPAAPPPTINLFEIINTNFYTDFYLSLSFIFRSPHFPHFLTRTLPIHFISEPTPHASLIPKTVPLCSLKSRSPIC